jgi:hypothetical protein
MLQAIMSQETLRMVYFVYILSITSYGIILGRKQPYNEKIFNIKRGLSELLLIQELETQVGNCLKNCKYCSYTYNMFLPY